MLPSNYKCTKCNSLLFCDIITKRDDIIEVRFGCSCKSKLIQMNLKEFLLFINSSIKIFSDENLKVSDKLYFCIDCKNYFLNNENESTKHLNHEKIHLINTGLKCKCNSEDLKFYCKELNKYFCQKCVNQLSNGNSHKNYSFEIICINEALLSSLKSINLTTKEFLN